MAATPSLEPGFSREKPTTVGLWEFICGETDGKPERVAISSTRDWLIVHSEHLGETVIDHFHDGLTQIRWRRIA